MRIVCVATVAVAALVAAGCGAARQASKPSVPTGALSVREVHAPGAPYFTEGAITYVRVAGAQHTLDPSGELRVDLPAGAHPIEIWHRPCDGTCTNLDPATDRCSASVDVRAEETAIATIRESPGEPCELAVGRAPTSAKTG